MQAHFRGSVHSKDGRKGYSLSPGHGKVTQLQLSMDVGAGAVSPRSGSCSAIKLFLEKMYSGHLLHGGSWVAHWPAENHILASVATGTITTISAHPEISGASSGLSSPAGWTGYVDIEKTRADVKKSGEGQKKS